MFSKKSRGKKTGLEKIIHNINIKPYSKPYQDDFVQCCFRGQRQCMLQPLATRVMKTIICYMYLETQFVGEKNISNNYFSEHKLWQLLAMKLN